MRDLLDAPTFLPSRPPVLRGQEHPLWEAQVEAEKGMLQEGADRVRQRVIKATEKRQMTRLSPVRGLMQDWLPGVADTLKAWVQQSGRMRGPKPIALPYIQNSDHYVLGLIAVRTMLDAITTERTGLTGLAVEIGRAVEHEQMVRHWEAKSPETFWRVQTYLDRTDATASHRRLVNVNRFNHLLESEDPVLSWERWPLEGLRRVGLTLVDAVVRSTGWFTTEQDPNHVHKKGKASAPRWIIIPKPELLDWLAKRLDDMEVNSPAYMPTIIPPKPWTDTRRGGYWTPYVRTPRLIRFKAYEQEQKERAADEYEALDMPKVYEAINYLQDVPWRINARVLDTVYAVRDLDAAWAGIPMKSPVERELLTPEVEADPEALKKWKRGTAEAIRRDLKRVAREQTFERTLHTAARYRDREEIYFPHMMDFRGRMYPIPVGLQPQGDDLARGLLEFADGKEITEDNGGAAWLAIHLSACWGYDKASYDERLAWVEAREDQWRRIAADPVGTVDLWGKTSGQDKVDKPWCLLAAVFEWVDFLEQGFGYVSHLPISVDGTCNGIQHLSAMTRDEVAGEYVNLVPGDRPRDIYKFVAGKLQAVLERLVADGGFNAEPAQWWLELCGGDLPRSLTKRQVMVLPYGGTKESFFSYTREWLDEMEPLPHNLDWSDEAVRAGLKIRTQRVTFLATLMWDVVKETVSGGMTVMEWLQKCARKTVDAGQPIFWETPSGFVVRHFYGKTKEIRVRTMVDGREMYLVAHETTEHLDPAAQLRGIAPNFVHSLDAAALTLSLISAKERGIVGFTSVHDAYGTHAADMWPLYHILREAFVLVHATDMLKVYRASCVAVGVAKLAADRSDADPMELAELVEEQMPAMPPRGRLDLGDVLSSDYFFA